MIEYDEHGLRKDADPALRKLLATDELRGADTLIEAPAATEAMLLPPGGHNLDLDK